MSDLPLDEALSFYIPVVVAASKREERSTDAPATVIVVSHHDIRTRGYRYLTDVLRDLPGMETVENYFSEVGTLVPVRGVAGNNKIVVLINGMRVNPPGGEDMMFRSDISVLDAERVEVIYGPGSTLYGQDAISAVINVVTAKPGDTTVSANLGGGLPTRGEAAVSFAKQVGEANITASLSYMNATLSDWSVDQPDEWKNYQAVAEPKGSGTRPTRWDKGFNFMARAELGNSSVQVWHRESSRSSSEGLPYTFAKLPLAIWHDRSTVAEARNILAISSRVDLESTLTFNRYEIEPDSHYIFQVAPDAWFFNDYKYGFGESGALEEKITARIMDGLTVIAGVSAADYKVIPKCTIPGGVDLSRDIVSQGGSFTYYTRPGDASSRVDVPRANLLTYQNFGTYLEGDWRVLPQLKLVLGGRVDSNTRFEQVPFSPRASVIWSATDKLTLKYIFTRAYVAPPPYFAYNIYDDGVAMNVANTQLAPETALSNEVNAEWNQENLKVGLSAYYNRETNLLVVGDAKLAVNIVSPEVYMDPQGTQTRLLTHSANSGETTALGVDAYTKLKLGRVAGWGSYSFVDLRNVTEGKETGLPGISAHQFRLGATVNILENLYVTPSLVLRSTPNQVAIVGNLGDQLRWPYEVNLYAAYSPLKNLEVYLRVRNLTDHSYALAGLVSNAYPAESISGTVGVRYAY